MPSEPAMNSPEREEVAKQLAEELGFEAWPDSGWSRMVKDIGHYLGENREWLPNDVRNALVSREMRVRELREAVQDVYGQIIEDTLRELEAWEKAGETHAKGELVKRNLPRFRRLQLALNSKGEKG